MYLNWKEMFQAVFVFSITIIQQNCEQNLESLSAPEKGGNSPPKTAFSTKEYTSTFFISVNVTVFKKNKLNLPNFTKRGILLLLCGQLLL